MRKWILPLGKVMAAFGQTGTRDLFVLVGNTQFRPGPARSLTSPRYTDDSNAVKTLGRANGSTRTEDQTALAVFWEGNARLHHLEREAVLRFLADRCDLAARKATPIRIPRLSYRRSAKPHVHQNSIQRPGRSSQR